MVSSLSAILESASASPIVAGPNAAARPNNELALRKRRRDLSSASFIRCSSRVVLGLGPGGYRVVTTGHESSGRFLPCSVGRIPGSTRPSPIRWIRLSLRIQRLHLCEFLGGDLRQVADEQNQAPGFLGSVRFAEG